MLIRNVAQKIYKECGVKLESANDLRVSVEQQVGVNFPTETAAFMFHSQRLVQFFDPETTNVVGYWPQTN